MSFFDFIFEADSKWDPSTALPSKSSGIREAIAYAIDQGVIWPHNKTARGYELVFNKGNTGILDLRDDWQVDRVGHKFIKYLTEDGKVTTLRTTGKAKASTQGSAASQEAGVCLWMDMIRQGLDHIDVNAVTDFYQSAESAPQIEAWLKANPTWNRDCEVTARAIVAAFPKINSYQVHHGSAEYRALRDHGKALSGLKPDRWNPSDIMLIKRDLRVFRQAMKQNDIYKFNGFFDGMYDDIIGISLKGSVSLHGSVAVSSILSHPLAVKALGGFKGYALPANAFEGDSLSAKGISAIIGMLKKCAKRKLIAGALVPNEDLISAMAKWPVNAVWAKSYPYALAMLASCRSDADLEDLAWVGYMYSTSRIDGVSCNYWKAVAGHKLEFYKANLNRNLFKLLGVRIPLNGDMSVSFDIQYDGEVNKLQFRSKGSLPQFIAMKRNEANADRVPLKNLL